MLAERLPRVRFYLAFWLFILSGVAFLDRMNISVAGMEVSAEYGLENQRLGWIFSAFLVGYAVFQLPAGWLTARFGPRKVLTAGVLWWAIATALTAAFPSNVPHAVLLLIAIRSSLGAGESVIYPAANQFVARWIPTEERGLVNGLIFAGVGVGSGLTPPLLTWIIAHHSWRAVFWFSGLLGLVVGAVWWYVARDTPEEHPWVSGAELREIHEGLPMVEVPRASSREMAGPEMAEAAQKSRGISWAAILHRRDLAALMVGYFGFGYVAWIFFGWFFLYMAQVRGLDLSESALYTMLPFLSMTVCSLAGGALSDYLTRRHGLWVGRCLLASGALATAAVCLVVGSGARSAMVAGVVLAVAAGALYVSQSSFWSVSADIAGRSSGVFASMVNMGGQVGAALTASLTPWIAVRFGWNTSFRVAAALAMIASLCWLTVHPEKPLDEAAL